jgi:hypothetical protein
MHVWEFDAAIVELRYGFGGGDYVFRFHMGLLRLALGGEFKVNLSGGGVSGSGTCT